VSAEIFCHETVLDRYGFIYKSYGHEAYYWEMVEMFKKFMLCSLTILIEPGKLAQLAFAFLVTMCFMAGHMQVLPFKDSEDDNFQSYSTLSTLLTLFAGILIKARSGDEQAEESAYEKALLSFILMLCNVGTLALFVFIVYKSATRGDGSEQGNLHERVLEKAQDATVKYAAQQAQEYVDVIFASIDECVSKLEEKFGVSMTTVRMLCNAMLTDMKEGSRGRYAGDMGVSRLMEDANGLISAGDVSEFCNGLMTIAGGFCGQNVISAMSDMAVDTIETMSKEEGSAISEDSVELMRVSVRVMSKNVANRDVLVQKMQEMCTVNCIVSGKIVEELASLPFLLCPDAATMNELIRIAMERIKKHLTSAGIPEEFVAVLAPVAASVVDLYVRGDKLAYSPEELVFMLQTILTKALEDPEQAGHLLLGMARNLLGDRVVDKIILQANPVDSVLTDSDGIPTGRFDIVRECW